LASPELVSRRTIVSETADGALGYVEIPAGDLTRVKAFYAAVFGWTYQDTPEGNYSFFDSGEGGIGGGFMQRAEESPAHPVIFMMCDDIDETLDRATRRGGAVVSPKMDFGGAGWLAHLTDTEGNLIGLWQGKPGGGA
jgi:predicted enzyme related to lactoylglutathione lyase